MAGHESHRVFREGFGLRVALSLIWVVSMVLVEALIRRHLAIHLVNLVVDLSQLLLTAGAGWATRSRASRGTGPFSPLWRALTWSMACLAGATAYAMLVADVQIFPRALLPITHLGFLAGVICLVWAILRLPVEDVLPSQRIQRLLDGLLISTSIFFVSWGGFLRSMVETRGIPGKAFTLVYPILGVAMAALWVFQESRSKGIRLGRSGVYLRMGLGIMVAWWPVYSIGAIQGWYNRPGISQRLDMGILLGILFIGHAALGRSQPVLLESADRRRQQHTVLIYLPGLIAMLFGGWLILRGENLDKVMVGSGMLLGLVLTYRQYITVRDLDRLSGDLEHRVHEQTLEIMASREEVSLRLISASEHRDNETGAHVRRIGLCTAELARLLGWDKEQVETIRTASPMHDIGKIGVPDRIMQKAGLLTEEEWAIMQTHTTMGAKILQGSTVPFIQMGARIAAAHHERWDGQGYPTGLMGEEIPLEARITCLVDSYDALIHRRVYKEAWEEPHVLAYVRENSGKRFDPALVALFLEHISNFRTILLLHPD